VLRVLVDDVAGPAGRFSTMYHRSTPPNRTGAGGGRSRHLMSLASPLGVSAGR
jgi:hypothetical protein